MRNALQARCLGIFLVLCSNTLFSADVKESAAPSLVQIAAQGRFTLLIKDDAKPKYQAIAQYLRKDGIMRDIVGSVNQIIALPYDIKVVVTTTGRGPLYRFSEKTVYIDYQMMYEQLEYYDKYHPKESKENRRLYFNNVTRFFLYHEMAHAVIDVYHLPVLGQEEDAADAFSAVFSLKYLPNGFQVLVDAADYFYLADKNEGTDASSYWDEHDLNRQRYYRLLCYAYGKLPGPVGKKIQYYYQGGLNGFIKERSSYCHQGYNDVYRSWMLLIQPYLKPVAEVK